MTQEDLTRARETLRSLAAELGLTGKAAQSMALAIEAIDGEIACRQFAALPDEEIVRILRDTPLRHLAFEEGETAQRPVQIVDSRIKWVTGDVLALIRAAIAKC